MDCKNNFLCILNDIRFEWFNFHYLDFRKGANGRHTSARFILTINVHKVF